MKLCERILGELISFTENEEFTNYLINKFISVHVLAKLERRLAKCYALIKSTDYERERKKHSSEYFKIGIRIETEDQRSVNIDSLLNPFLKTLSKDDLTKYELLLCDFKLSLI